MSSLTKCWHRQSIIIDTRMRGSIFILLIVGLISKGHGQEIMVAGSTIDIENFNGKYRIKIGDKVILDNIDSIGVYENNTQFYTVKKGGKYGMYSNFGVEKIPVIFEKINLIFNEYRLVQSNQKVGVYNLYTGKSLPAKYDHIKFSGKVGVEFIVKKENKYGVLDYELNVVVPITYDFIDLYGGLLELTSGNKKSYLLGTQIVNHKILTNKVFQVYGQYSSDARTYYVFEEQNKFGIISSIGEIVWQPKYDDIVPIRRIGNKAIPEYIFFVKSDKKWGITDQKDNVIAPVEYQSVEMGYEDYALVKVDNLKQFYDLKNKQVVQGISFERFYYLTKYSRIEKNGLETLIDNETMKLLFPFKYEFLLHGDSGEFSAGVYNKYGIIDVNDKQIIPFVYDEPLFVSCGNKIVARKGNQYGIIDKNNKVLVQFSTRLIVAYHDGFERSKEDSFETEKLDCNLKINKKN